MKRLLEAPFGARTGDVNDIAAAPPVLLPSLPPRWLSHRWAASRSGLAAAGPHTGATVAALSSPSPSHFLAQVPSDLGSPPVSLLKRLVTFRLLRGLLDRTGGCFCRSEKVGGSGEEMSIAAAPVFRGPGVETSATPPDAPSRAILEGVAACLMST